MRIEAYNQIAKVYEANQTAGKAKTTKAGAGRDEVISGKRRLQRLQRR